MKYELGDHSFVRCPELGLSADIEFKTKGYFGGTYNAIGGMIKNDKTGEALFELSGMWTGEMWLKDLKVRFDGMLKGNNTDEEPDWEEGASIQRYQSKTHSPKSKTT